MSVSNHHSVTDSCSVRARTTPHASPHLLSAVYDNIDSDTRMPLVLDAEISMSGNSLIYCVVRGHENNATLSSPSAAGLLRPKVLLSNMTSAWSAWLPLWHATNYGTFSLTSLSKLLLLIFCVSRVHQVSACYKFPPGTRNPCEGQVCKFGAECMPSIDGTIARCQCPLDCPSYGDSIDSKPVCGNDGKDHANLCELRKTACYKLEDIRVKYYGKCGRLLFFMLVFVCRFSSAVLFRQFSCYEYS